MDSERTREILKKVRQVEVRTNRLVDDSMAGQYHSVFKGKGMDFDQVRAYTPGDEIRSIDWNVTARAGTPFVKRFREERELTIMLMIDISGSGDFGSGEQSKRELAAEMGAVLAFSALKNNDKVGLVLFSDDVELYIPPGKGRRHVLRIVREILFYEPQGRGTNFEGPLDFVNRVLRKRSVIFLVSDFCLTGEFEPVLAGLQRKLVVGGRRHDLVSVSVTDPRDTDLPDVGLLTVEDAETGELVELNTSSRDLRRAFQQLSEERQETLRKALRRAKVDLLEISTDTPYLPALIEFFGKREERGRRK
ncbi:MAG: DUF58 domain-containing protein [Verrucomicrobiota bacterium]